LLDSLLQEIINERISEYDISEHTHVTIL